MGGDIDMQFNHFGTVGSYNQAAFLHFESRKACMSSYYLKQAHNVGII